MSKLKWAAGLGTTFGAQGIIIPLLSLEDSGITAVTVAGSSSLFDFFEQLSDRAKNPKAVNDFKKIALSILPTGSAWGREALVKKEVDLAITSTKSNNIYGKPSDNLVQNIVNVVNKAEEFLKGREIKDWSLSDDNIAFLTLDSSNDCFTKVLGGGVLLVDYLEKKLNEELNIEIM